jgi:hypothetical protein
MSIDEIKRAADLTNGGVLRDVYLDAATADALRADGYRVAGSNVYVPRWVPERPIITGPLNRKADDDHDWEGAILARQRLDV